MSEVWHRMTEFSAQGMWKLKSRCQPAASPHREPTGERLGCCRIDFLAVVKHLKLPSYKTARQDFKLSSI